MSYLKKAIKYGVTTSLIIGTMIFTGCSSKSTSYSYGGGSGSSSSSSTNINKFYKYNPDKNIRNSKAMHRATLRPYTVFGVKYYPKVVDLGFVHNGIASWYGPNFHAKKTSNGETYDMYAMTAAHKTLPMNTMVRVDNLENGKSTIVRINDRGPFVAGRIIDLSNKAAHAIDMVKKGTVKVKVTVLGYNGILSNANSPIAQMPQNTQVTLGQKVKNINAVEKLEPFGITEQTVSQPVQTSTPKKVVPSIGNYNIQVGAFGRVEGAMATKAKYEALTNGKYNVVVNEVQSAGRILHKVYITGFDSYNHAQLFKESNSLNGMILEK